MKHFDENGNFIEFEPEVELDSEQKLQNRKIEIKYIFKSKEEE